MDEIVFRLVTKGLLDADGTFFKPHLVRVGAALADAPDEVVEVTLDYRLQKRLTNSAIYQKHIKVVEELQELRKRWKEIKDELKKFRYETDMDKITNDSAIPKAVLEKEKQDRKIRGAGQQEKIPIQIPIPGS